MRRLLIGMVAVLVAAAQGHGLTRHPLGVAQDPENLESAIYGEALYNLNLRLGPSEEFDSIAVIRGGSEIPIIGWVSGADGESLWVRTWYGERKGWTCGFYGEERLIARDGRPLLPLAVVADGLLFQVKKARKDWPFNWKEILLKEGSALEFVSVCDNELYSPGWHDCRVYVKYGEDFGSVNIFGNEPKREVDEEDGTVTTEPSAWAVSYSPEFTELSLEYQSRAGMFEFVGPEEYGYLFSGPGTKYEKLGSHDRYVITDTVFAEGTWALVKVWGGFGWTYLGTAEEPNIQTYGHYKAVLCDYPPPLEEKAEGEVLVSVKISQWPRADKVYVEIKGPYFKAYYIENTIVERISIFQPPTPGIPLYSGPPDQTIYSSWHETGFKSCGVTMPKTFTPGEPFRVIADMSFKETDKFEMEFLCIADK